VIRRGNVWIEQVLCALCGAVCKSHDCMAGYARLPDERKICYGCASLGEALSMLATGKAFLYEGESHVGDWPGGFALPVVRRKEGRHNMSGKRTDVWFRDWCGRMWHGVRCTDNGNYLRCTRLAA
jgi:hypothetical protein